MFVGNEKKKDFHSSILFFWGVFFKAQKAKYLILIFSDILPLVFINKFCKKKIISPPGDPRELHLGKVRTKMFEQHKNFRKDKITGRVDKLWRIFLKS